MTDARRTIPSAGASITQLEIDLVTEAVKQGWYEDRNMHLDQFKKEFAEYTGAKYLLPTCNCTSAIHLALLGLNIGPGDEVIVPDVTWVASAAPIHYVGARPVFADIDPVDWCLSPESFKQNITNRTKAVVVVDLYGNMPRMDEIKKIADENGVVIIEDAAEAIGAKYKGKAAGTFGRLNVFSFNATKLMMAGQGGMLTTDDQKVFEKCKQLSHHGMVKYTDKTTFWSVEIGYNYLWTNIQAALALAQLRRLDELVAQRRRIFKWYQERLKDFDGIQMNSEAKDVLNTYWVVTAVLDHKYNLKKEVMMAEFSKNNIDTRPFFYPVSSMPAYSEYVKGKDMKVINPNCYDLAPRGISFPSAATLTEAEVDHVCNVFRKILKEKGAL